MFFDLLVGHWLCDAFQGFVFPRKYSHFPNLLGHAITHGISVRLITGSAWLGGAEVIAHLSVDWMHGHGYFGTHVDQALHVGFKLLWVLLLKA